MNNSILITSDNSEDEMTQAQYEAMCRQKETFDHADEMMEQRSDQETLAPTK